MLPEEISVEFLVHVSDAAFESAFELLFKFEQDELPGSFAKWCFRSLLITLCCPFKLAVRIWIASTNVI